MAVRKKTRKKKTAAESAVEDRLGHVETILHRLLGAHGEIYAGATDDRDALGLEDADDELLELGQD
jgi:hypothetical protein